MDHSEHKSSAARLLRRVAELVGDEAWEVRWVAASRSHLVLALRRELLLLNPRVPMDPVATLGDVLDVHEALLGRRVGSEKAGQPFREVLQAVLNSAEHALWVIRQGSQILLPMELDALAPAVPVSQFGDVLLAELPPAALFDALARGSLAEVDLDFMVKVASVLHASGEAQRLARCPALMLMRFPLQEVRQRLAPAHAQMESLLATTQGTTHADLQRAVALGRGVVSGEVSVELFQQMWRAGEIAALQGFQDVGFEYFRCIWACIYHFERVVPPWFVASYLGSLKPWRICFGTQNAGAEVDAGESVVVDVSRQHLGIEFSCPSAFVYCLRLRSIFQILDCVADICPADESLRFRVVLGDECGSEGTVSFSSNRASSILIPDPYFLDFKGYRSEAAEFARHGAPFGTRSSCAYWRGSDTGVYRYAHPGLSPRVRVSRLSNESPGQLNAKIVNVERRVNWEKNHALYEREQLVGAPDPIEQILAHKYNLDIDGNSNAWNGFFLKLLSGSVVLKVDSEFGFKQWYYPRLEAWTHYVPVLSDLSDLFEKIAFLERHSGLAESIGQNGRRFAGQMSVEAEVAAAAHRILARSLAEVAD